ncbi:RNA polymerase sigma factor [Flavonifractor plautii]|uniref:RNA polymerase sigma factor n=1 Tax=Flavonifractor plautii TaxID=292800 RepID=UPI003EE9DC24
MMPDKNELVERLYRLHFKKLFIYANAVLRDPEQAKDVVQDTFHEALRRIDVFAKHENPGGWLMNTLKNKLKENERTRRRISSVCSPWMPISRMRVTSRRNLWPRSLSRRRSR